MENKKYVYLEIKDFYAEKYLGLDVFRIEEEYEEQVIQALKEAIDFWNSSNLSIFPLQEVLKEPLYQNKKLIDLNNNLLGIIGENKFEELAEESFVYVGDTLIFLDTDFIEGYEGLINLINTILEKRDLNTHCEKSYIKKMLFY